MGANATYANQCLNNQQMFAQFFQSSFDKYDRNHDGRIDANELPGLVNEMMMQIKMKYGQNIPYQAIQNALQSLDYDGNYCLTRNEFSDRAMDAIEKSLAQAGYFNQGGQMYGMQRPHGHFYRGKGNYGMPMMGHGMMHGHY